MKLFGIISENTLGLYGETFIEDNEDNLPETDLLPDKPNKSEEIIKAQQYLDKIDAEYRDGNNHSVPLNFEQRLDLALKDSKKALKYANVTIRAVNNLNDYIQRGFNDIGVKLDKIADGKSIKDPDDEPGTHVLHNY